MFPLPVEIEVVISVVLVVCVAVIVFISVNVDDVKDVVSSFVVTGFVVVCISFEEETCIFVVGSSVVRGGDDEDIVDSTFTDCPFVMYVYPLDEVCAVVVDILVEGISCVNIEVGADAVFDVTVLVVWISVSMHSMISKLFLKKSEIPRLN